MCAAVRTLYPGLCPPICRASQEAWVCRRLHESSWYEYSYVNHCYSSTTQLCSMTWSSCSHPCSLLYSLSAAATSIHLSISEHDLVAGVAVRASHCCSLSAIQSIYMSRVLPVAGKHPSPVFGAAWAGTFQGHVYRLVQHCRALHLAVHLSAGPACARRPEPSVRSVLS
jgi:hypothetical protein